MSANRGRRERIRRDKNENDKETRELVFKKEGQEYAQVVKMLGNGRVETNCYDGTSRLAYIREEQRKKANVGDILLLQLRDYRDAKADVIFVYTLEEAINLKAYGELTETAKINVNVNTHKAEDDNITYDNYHSDKGEGIDDI